MAQLKRHSVLPGFGLSLGYTLFYLSAIVLLPLSALILRTAPPPQTDRQGGELLQAVSLQPGDTQTYLTDRDMR